MDLMKIDFTMEQPTISARILHDKLEIKKRFSAWFETNSNGFIENTDFTSVLSSTVVNNGAERELQDYNVSLDMAKHICLMSRTERGKKCRQYLIDMEKAWNSPAQIMARALQMADKTIKSLEIKNEVLDKENELLSAKTLMWNGRPFINACVRQYAGHACEGNFGIAWVEFKKELLYKYGININSRITNYLNSTGRKTKPKTLSMLDDSEVTDAVSTIVSMCREKNIDISELMRNLNLNSEVTV